MVRPAVDRAVCADEHQPSSVTVRPSERGILIHRNYSGVFVSSALVNFLRPSSGPFEGMNSSAYRVVPIGVPAPNAF
jgi:hypothetical protein